MPHRRPVQEGSFGGRLDRLVEHFPPKPGEPRRKRTAAESEADERHINERLFESVWRKARAGRRAGAKQP